MHAEQTSHAGLCANHFCRTCDVGGTKAYKKSNEGFAKIFEVSILLFACDTCDFTSFRSGAYVTQMRPKEPLRSSWSFVCFLVVLTKSSLRHEAVASRMR